MNENIPLKNALSDISRYANALQNALDNEDFSLENCSLIAKNFSKEIEYSDENVEALSYFCLL